MRSIVSSLDQELYRVNELQKNETKFESWLWIGSAEDKKKENPNQAVTEDVLHSFGFCGIS